MPSLVDSRAGSITEPYYYVYDYEGTDVSSAKARTNYKTYGVLYNWTAAKQACPSGWHLPSDDEWKQLTNHLGGENVAGGKLKEIGTSHWKKPNIGATNETGFTALPGGFRSSSAGSLNLSYAGFYNSQKNNFDWLGEDGNWWSATEDDNDKAWEYYLFYNNNIVNRNSYNKDVGLSVRCVRD